MSDSTQAYPGCSGNTLRVPAEVEKLLLLLSKKGIVELDKYKALVGKLLAKPVEIKVPSGYKEAKEKLDKIPD